MDKLQTQGLQMRSEWTVDTLKEYLLRLLVEHEQRHSRTERHIGELREAQRDSLNIAILSVERTINAAVDNNREGLVKFETAMEKRLDSMNEFRQTLSDQQAKFISRSEHDSVVLRLTERMQDLADRQNLAAGKGAGLASGWQYLIAFVGAVSAMMGIFMMLRH